MFNRLRCGFGLVPEFVPRFGFGPVSDFSTSQRCGRDKSLIYNSNHKPFPKLIEGEGRGNRKRSAPTISPSEELNDAFNAALRKCYMDVEERMSSYFPSGLKLNRYLKSRTLPLEGVHLRRKQALINEILAREFPDGDEDNVMLYQEQEKGRIGYARRKERLEKVHLRHWVPIKFDATAALSYLVVRTPAEYAVLETIFKEIKRQDPTFSPKTMFDFGSGLGTGYWAAKHVFGKFAEVFCVDKSTDMNDVARNIILKGNENTPLPVGMSFRLQCPSTISLKYSLVVCAYTLMELESSVKRIEVIQTLWDRLEEGGCLVLAELGTNAGFQIICEARDYLLQVGGLEEDENKMADILAPCPHTQPCPRYTTDTIPCNFRIKYRMFDMKYFEKDFIHSEMYSYVVIKKGKRSRASLPRLVEEPLKTKHNYYCRMCTQAGTLQEVVCNKRHTPELFQLSKYMHLGDEMPIQLDYTPVQYFAKLRGQSALNADEPTNESKYLFKADEERREDGA